MALKGQAHHSTSPLAQHTAETEHRNLSSLSQPLATSWQPASQHRSLSKPLATPFEPLLQRRVRKGWTFGRRDMALKGQAHHITSPLAQHTAETEHRNLSSPS